MKITLVAVGTRMPGWVEAGVQEYAKRLPRDFGFGVKEVPMAPRGKNANVPKLIDKEGEACLEAVSKGNYVAALDVAGRALSTEQLAAEIGTIRESAGHLVLLAGGPDGLAPACLQRADATWSLSALTLPHPVVRIVVAEQIYRAWSILHNHPYHRG